MLKIAALPTLLALSLLLGGCATSSNSGPSWPWPDEPSSDSGRYGDRGDAPPPPRDSGPGEMRRAEELPPAEQMLVASNDAGQSLLDDARGARAGGDAGRAASLLERGISIAPRDAVLWYELAETRRQQGRLDDAETLALRALEYAWEGEAVNAYSWALIADVREARGDTQGAARAREKATLRL